MLQMIVKRLETPRGSGSWGSALLATCGVVTILVTGMVITDLLRAGRPTVATLTAVPTESAVLTAPEAKRTFGVGSTKQEVIAAQGSPDPDPNHKASVGGIDPTPRRVFAYGEAEVIFGDDDRVVRWNDPKGQWHTKK